MPCDGVAPSSSKQIMRRHISLIGIAPMTLVYETSDLKLLIYSEKNENIANRTQIVRFGIGYLTIR